MDAPFTERSVEGHENTLFCPPTDKLRVVGHVALVPRDLRRRLGAPRLALQLVLLADPEELRLVQDLHRLRAH